MSWFRLDDKFHSHQKVVAARNAAVGLYVRCGTWSADQGTEGRIPTHVAKMFGSKAEIERVTASGLWQPTVDGYLIPDYLLYNLSNDEVADRRDKRSEAGRKGGLKSGESRRSKHEANGSLDDEANTKQTGKQTSKQNRTESNPDPTRPDPTPPTLVIEQLDDSTSDLLRQSAVLFAEFKFTSNPTACKGLPSKYKAGIVTNVLTEQTGEMLAYLERSPLATAEALARNVLGVPKPHAPPPTWHYDPGCDDHGADGMVTMPDGGAGTPTPCPCRRAEPYPEPPHADVIQLYKGGAA